MKTALRFALAATGFLVILPSARVSAQAPVPAQPAAAAQAPRAAASVRPPTSDIVVTASRITKPLVLDGRLDDEVYQQVAPRTGFFQQEPKEGEQATEQTEVWILFDDNNLYLVAKCLDSHPEREILTELRRDSSGIFQNESVTFVLDTFKDLRNGFKFQTNALGAVQESAVVDEINNESWNTVWDLRTVRGDWGWSVEMVVPFKSLRYPGSGPQTWGINVRRVIKYKNELTYLSPLPASFGVNAIYHMGSHATLVGVETPAQSINLELKPYVVATLTTDLKAEVPFDERCHRERRIRLQVRTHARSDVRRDREHRFRTGGGRPPAGEPHAVQPLLSRKARLLPGGPGHLRVRRRQPGPEREPRRSAGALLQPADRLEQRAVGAGGRRRAGDGPNRPLPDRPVEHPDGRRQGRARRFHELHGDPHQARHPAAQQHRHHRHEPIADDGRHRHEPGVRRRHEFLPVQERHVEPLLLADLVSRTRPAARTATGDVSTMPGIDTGWRRSIF